MRLEDVYRAGDKGGFRADGQRDGIERAIDGTERRRFRFFVEFGSRGILAFGQPVDAIVEEQDFDADIAAQHMDGVIAADGQSVTVSGGNPYFQIGANGFDSGGYGWRTAMNGVKAEGVHVIREAAGAADSRNDHKVFALDAEFGENRLNRGENGVVPAAGAPADFLVGLKILFRQRRRQRCGTHDRFSVLNLEHLFDFLLQLALLKRAALDFVQAHSVHQILGAQHPKQLAHIQFRHQNLLIALDHFAEVGGQRIQMAQMNVADLAALGALRVHSGGDGSMRRAPRDNQQIAVRIAGRLDFRNVLRDGRDLRGADAHHFFVVQRLIVDVAGDILLFEAADAVLEPRRARHGPGTRQRLRIALVRQVAICRIGFRGEVYGERRYVRSVGNVPGFRAVGEIAVR